MNNPFEIEKLRSGLATKGNIKKLMKTYEKSYPEIEDLNTPNLWNSLNKISNFLPSNNPMAWDRLNITASLIKGKAIKAIDIGFGSATLEKIILTKGNNLDWYGIDISPESVKTASNQHPCGKFRVGSITNMNFESETFDYAIALEVLEHIKPSQAFKAYKEVRRILKPKGIFIMSVPLNESLEKMVAHKENPNAHVRVYTPHLIKAELSIAGFKIIKTKLLYAFGSNYRIKSMISRIIPGLRENNNIIVIAQKP